MNDLVRSVIIYLIRLQYRLKNRKKNIILEPGCIVHKIEYFGIHSRVCKKTEFKVGSIGNYSYLGEKCFFIRTKIGNFTSIGKNCSVIVGKHPSNTFVSTHPIFYSLRKQLGNTFVTVQKFDDFNLTENGYSIEIGHDVWIGEGVKILEGVKIGDGAIVGAYSLVTKNIEPYTINVGFPAKSIAKRFDAHLIDWLLEFKWWNKNLEWIQQEADNFENIEILYEKYRK